MHFSPPLKPAILLRRYKRFLADVRLEDGSDITVVCPNTGAMTGVCTPGARVWISTASNPKRKYAQTWELIEVGGRGLIGIHSAQANTIVAEALVNGSVFALKDYRLEKREVRLGDSRIDFLLHHKSPAQPNCYLEVKSVTFSRQTELAEFPDTRTARGMRHLQELTKAVASGHRAIMLYLVQCERAQAFRIADDLDPDYAEAFNKAHEAGVEALAFTCQISEQDITISQQIPLLRQDERYGDRLHGR